MNLLAFLQNKEVHEINKVVTIARKDDIFYWIKDDEIEVLGKKNKVELLEEITDRMVVSDKQWIAVIEKFFPVPQSVKEKNEAMQTLKDEIARLTDYRYFSRKFVDERGVYYDNSGNWWFFNDTKKCWELIDDTTLLNFIDEIGFGEDTLNAKVKLKILEALKREGRKKKPQELPKTYIQFNDTIINYMTGEKIPATKEWFSLNPVPHTLGENDSTPQTDVLFNEWVGAENTKKLYEIVAFVLSSEYFIHRILCLTGAGSNGKSTFIDLLINLIGKENACSSDLDILISSRFEAARLYKKLLCTMGETNFTTLSKTNKLKSLTGQDLIGMEFKNKKPFEDVNYAKILIATNSLPETEDKTEGFWRRWDIIDFSNQFLEKVDILARIPEEEYQNLCLKCCNILKDLRNNCTFSFSGTIEDRRVNYEKHSNPVNQFIKENFDLNENNEMPFFEFYDRYIEHCRLKGIRELSKRSMGIKLKELGFEKYDKSVKKENGDLTSWVFIIGFKPKEISGSMQEPSTAIREITVNSLLATHIEKEVGISTLSPLTPFTNQIEEKTNTKQTDEESLCSVCKLPDTNPIWYDGAYYCGICLREVRKNRLR